LAALLFVGDCSNVARHRGRSSMVERQLPKLKTPF
jgi:hypothetical protein